MYFENTGNTSWSKIRHNFRKWSGSKIGVRAPVRQKFYMILDNRVVQKLELEKNVFFTKNGLLN